MAREHTATFRFYEELNDFLPRLRRGRELAYAFNGIPGIKDAIEAQGIPHTEVELILVNGESCGFDRRLEPGDRVSVYPVFETLDISPLVRLRERPLRRTAFILDVHLGRLARLLRLLGFDTLYRTDYDDPEIIRIALAEHRIILTRDRRLLRDRRITHGRWLHSTDAREQAREVIGRFQLEDAVRRFVRCPLCNGLVRAVGKSEVLDRLEPLTRRYYSEFYRCTDCLRIYWKGSHYARIVDTLNGIAPAKKPSG
jgi:uncharacterized protein with PIN domain